MTAPSTDQTAFKGGFASPAYDAAHAFRGAMRAMACPGSIENITGAKGPNPLSIAAASLLLTLCDPDTSVYLAGHHDNEAVRTWLSFHTGAPVVEAAEADFAVGTWNALQPTAAYKIGEPAYPDRSATLIVEQPSLEQRGAILTGPGIETTAALNVPDVPIFQANQRRFPLGFDCFLTAGEAIAALPRTTQIKGEA